MSRTLSIPTLDPLHGTRATPSSFIRAIVMAYRRYGLDPRFALATARIDPDRLHEAQGCVTAAQMEIMSAIAMQELDDEALGWFSRKLPWGSHGMLCRASLSSPNLGVALRRWCRHLRLLTDDIQLEMDADRNEARVTILDEHLPAQAPEMRELCLVTNLRNLLGYASWLVDSHIPLIEARFSFAAPAHSSAYPLMFAGPTRFDAEHAGLSFDVRYLELTVRRDEADLQRMLQRALALTVLQYRRDRLLTQKIRQMLRFDPNEARTAEALAEKLHISARSLYRQLHDEGVSLQELKDAATFEHAVELLQRTSQPIKQIARAVGFGNEKSFSRAFKKWSGHSPGLFRAQQAVRAPGKK